MLEQKRQFENDLKSKNYTPNVSGWKLSPSEEAEQETPEVTTMEEPEPEDFNEDEVNMN